MSKMEKKLAPIFSMSLKAVLKVVEKQELMQRMKEARLVAQLKRQEQQDAGEAESAESSLRQRNSTAEGLRKRTHNLSLSIDKGSAKRFRQDKEFSLPPSAQPKTPDNPPPLIDPNYTDQTGTTSEKKDETATAHLLRVFLESTMTVLGDDFRRIGWHQSSSDLVQIAVT